MENRNEQDDHHTGAYKAMTPAYVSWESHTTNSFGYEAVQRRFSATMLVLQVHCFANGVFNSIFLNGIVWILS